MQCISMWLQWLNDEVSVWACQFSVCLILSFPLFSSGPLPYLSLPSNQPSFFVSVVWPFCLHTRTPIITMPGTSDCGLLCLSLAAERTRQLLPSNQMVGCIQFELHHIVSLHCFVFIKYLCFVFFWLFFYFIFINETQPEILQVKQIFLLNF